MGQLEKYKIQGAIAQKRVKTTFNHSEALHFAHEVIEKKAKKAILCSAK